MKKITITLLTFVLTVLTACEKAVYDEENTKSANKGEKTELTLRVTNYRQVAYTATRAVEDITGYSSRLNFVIYQNGKQVESLMQMQDDEGYGQVSLKLQAGTYKVLVLAHSSKGNPLLTNAENIQFTNKISYSDTFYYYGDITIGTEAKTHDIFLTRVASMLRFIINDDIPSDVAKIRLQYTGGSGVLNAVTGYGANVDSKQEKLYNIEGLTAPLVLSIYTFLQADEGKLQVTVIAEDKNNTPLLERSFSDIPMKRNAITEYSGSFFEHNNAFTFKAETDWSDTIRVAY